MKRFVILFMVAALMLSITAAGPASAQIGGPGGGSTPTGTCTLCGVDTSSSTDNGGGLVGVQKKGKKGKNQGFLVFTFKTVFVS
jgi:hypothetical protein